MSFTNADPNKFVEYIDSLILKEAYDKAVLSSKEEDDDEDFDLDDIFGDIGVEREKIKDDDVVNIILDELLDPVDDSKLVFGTFPEDDRVDDSTLFNRNQL